MGFVDSKTIKGIYNVLGLAKRHFIVSSFLIIIFLIVGSYAGYKTTRWLETPEFCSISVCHASMAAYSQYFKISSHGQHNLEYQCMECHGETRLGPIENKYLGTLLSHVTDSPPAFIGLILGRTPDPKFDPFYPSVPNERCLRCHAPDAKGKDAFPLMGDHHKYPIDVREECDWAIENPRGLKYQCKNCHNFITHPTDTELLPTERGKKYDYTHPGFPKIDFGPWQQAHLHLLGGGGNDLEFRYAGNSEENVFEVTADDLVINGVPRRLDKNMCKICHKLEKMRPENMDGKCQGCHNDGKITLFEHEPRLHLPNLNDYIGAKGIVGGGEVNGH
jgi:hypothetical protein